MSETVTQLDIGDIVMISDYGNNKWLTCYGWYTYNHSRCNGWYFKQIPNGKILPMDDVDMEHVTKVSPQPCPPGPQPGPQPGPEPGPSPTSSDGSFITVDTMYDLKKLGLGYPVEGRIVRVNETDEHVPGYFIWNADTLTWDVFEFPTSSETTEKLNSMESDIQELKDWDWVLLENTVTD